MKRTQLLVVVVLVLICAACMPAVAAPVPIPTPTKTPTPVPIPTPIGTLDPVWADMCAELEENLAVCLLASDEIEATLLTGPVIVAKLIFAGEDLNFSTLEVDVAKSEVGYEVFVVDAGRDLSGFDRVFIHTAVGEREWEFGFPVAYCQPQNP